MHKVKKHTYYSILALFSYESPSINKWIDQELFAKMQGCTIFVAHIKCIRFKKNSHIIVYLPVFNYEPPLINRIIDWELSAKM